MITSQVLSRQALIWLCVSQVLVVLPHLERLPLWLGGLLLITIFYRLNLFRARLSLANRPVRLALMCLVFGGVAASYQTLIGLEPMVALLVGAASLKILESFKTRDGYLLASLAFFVCVTNFLFDQGLPLVIYSTVILSVLVVSLIALNQIPGSVITRAEFFLAAKLLLLALPMMVALFLLFPRIEPLWSIPSKSGQGVTGMSVRIRLGDVSRLSRSADVAFRAQFVGTIPPQQELYWRGVVIDRYEDGLWTRSATRGEPGVVRDDVIAASENAPVSYRVMLQPTMQPWLYALPVAQSKSPGVVETANFTLQSARKVENQFGYDVTSRSDIPRDLSLSPEEYQRATHLPQDSNPRTQAWVESLLQELPTRSAFIQAVLKHFRDQPFYYTLSPAPLPDEHELDHFLFETRQGFCEHYASAFVVMMRMAGIPARIVAGYQGGEFNSLNNGVTVRQFDAHAWAEVWLPENGWRRVDPTAAVAPERISLGLEWVLSGESDFLADSPLSLYRFRHFALIDWLRVRYDAAAYQWQSVVVGFTNVRQIDLLKSWFGEINVGWFTALLLGSWMIVLAPLTWVMNRARAGVHLPEETRFLQAAAPLIKRGFDRHFGESPTVFLRRVKAHGDAPDRDIQRLSEAVDSLYRSTTARFPHPRKIPYH